MVLTSASILHLIWDPPSTLDIIDVHPDISNYTVYITNVNTSNSAMVTVNETDINGVVKTEYTFIGLPGEDPVDPQHMYQFSVSAWNLVGEGEESEPVYGHFTEGLQITKNSIHNYRPVNGNFLPPSPPAEVLCPMEVDSVWNIQWSYTETDTTATESCGVDTSG